MRSLLLVAVTAVLACGGAPVADLPSSTATTTVASSPLTGTDGTATSLVVSPTTTGTVPSTTTKPVSTTTPASDPSPYDPALQSLVDAALADLAGRLGVEESAITVVSAEAVVWPDGAIGCPQPGMVYTQVQVEGAKVVLDHQGTTFAYHSGGGKPVFLCEGS